MRFAASGDRRVALLVSTVKTSKPHTMINLECYGEATTGLYRICEI